MNLYHYLDLTTITRIPVVHMLILCILLFHVCFSKKLLYIPTVELLITFLNFSEDLRNFCCLNSVPDAFFFTTLKQDYAHDIESFFHKLVDIIELICKELGESSLKNRTQIHQSFISLILLVLNVLLKKTILSLLIPSLKNLIS